MGRYTIRRLLQMIPVLIGTTFIIYAMVWALPGDPFAGKCGDRPCPPAYVAEMRAKFNLDDSLPVQYLQVPRQSAAAATSARASRAGPSGT
ncbi:MAG: hypothetical protein V9G10_15170 [Candidatus Nanopelagicales bacterium]